jgi:hypothetical protein
MFGSVESLNASVASRISLDEVRRQRQLANKSMLMSQKIMRSSLLRNLVIFSIFMMPKISYAKGGFGDFGLAFLIINIFQFVFYVAVLFLFLAAIISWKKDKKITTVIFGSLVLVPFLHFAYVNIDAHFEAQDRVKQLVQLQKEKVKPLKKPTIMQVTPFHSDKDLDTLVATGVLKELQAFNYHKQSTIVTQLKTGDDCLQVERLLGSHSEFGRVILARHAFMRCVAKTNRNETPNADVRLFSRYENNEAPNMYKGSACLAGGNNPLELRESEKLGNRLIDYWESPDFLSYAFPPQLLFHEHIWRCSDIPPNDYAKYHPDQFRFVASALGYQKPEEFSKDRDQKNVIRALNSLSVELVRAAYASKSIVALLGQWESTPEIQAELARLNDKQKEYISKEASTVISDMKKTQALYPYLNSHLPLR